METKKPVNGKGPNCKLKDDPIENKVVLTSVSDAEITLMEGTPAVNKKTWKVGTAKGSKKHRKSLEEERSESGDGTKENTLSSVSSDEANEDVEESGQVRQPSKDKLIP